MSKFSESKNPIDQFAIVRFRFRFLWMKNRFHFRILAKIINVDARILAYREQLHLIYNEYSQQLLNKQIRYDPSMYVDRYDSFLLLFDLFLVIVHREKPLSIVPMECR